MQTVAAERRHLAVYVPHLRLGGGELSMLRLAQGLAHGQGDGGLRVTLLVHSLHGAELAVPPGVALSELGADATRGTLGSLRQLAQWLRAARPTWLLSAFPHTNVAAVAAAVWARSGCRCVVSEHAPLSLQITRQGSWRYRVLPPLVRWAYRRADAVVAVSQGVRQDLLAMAGPGLRLHTIANPVLDAPGTAPAGDPATTPLHPWLLDEQLRVVLSVSRLSQEKDIPTLLRAFQQLHAQRPNTRLLLAGDGPARTSLQALVTQLHLDGAVALAGRIQAPRQWMQHAAVFALASQYEGFGNVLVEALASGCPVVSTDCPVGPREILADGRFGNLVPVGDWQAMAQALLHAVDHPGLPPGAASHAWQFTDAAACGAYRQLLDSLLPATAAPGAAC
jgi:glycosyltransferase involved in cell wall biosynthesis